MVAVGLTVVEPLLLTWPTPLFTGTGATLDREVQSVTEGVAMINCQLLPDRGFSERAFHWRLKTKIVPLLDFSLGMADGRLRRIKLTIMSDVQRSEHDMPAISEHRDGLPIFDTQLWKPAAAVQSFPEQFVDEIGNLYARWISSTDLWVCLDPACLTPVIECAINHSLSVMFDGQSHLKGILIKDLSDEEGDRIRQVILTLSPSAP